MSKKRCSKCKRLLSAVCFPYLFGPCGQCRKTEKLKPG